MPITKDNAYLEQAFVTLKTLCIELYSQGQMPNLFSQDTYCLSSWRMPNNTSNKPCYIKVITQHDGKYDARLTKRLNTMLHLTERHIQMQRTGSLSRNLLSSHEKIALMAELA